MCDFHEKELRDLERDYEAGMIDRATYLATAELILDECEREENA